MRKLAQKAGEALTAWTAQTLTGKSDGQFLGSQEQPRVKDENQGMMAQKKQKNKHKKKLQIPQVDAAAEAGILADLSGILAASQDSERLVRGADAFDSKWVYDWKAEMASLLHGAHHF